jgi:hypothetical protein
VRKVAKMLGLFRWVLIALIIDVLLTVLIAIERKNLLQVGIALGLTISALLVGVYIVFKMRSIKPFARSPS